MKERALPEVVENLFLTFRKLHKKYPQLSDEEVRDILIKQIIPLIYDLARAESFLSLEFYQELFNALFNFARAEEYLLHEEVQKSFQQASQKAQGQEGNACQSSRA